MSEEFFIRLPDAEDAKGPYNIEQLVSLAEAKKITSETQFYDDQKEVWLALRASKELHEQIFPSERKLSLRQGQSPEMELLNEAVEESSEKVSIEQILAAADGDTDETRHKASGTKWKERTSQYTLWSITLTLLMSAGGFAYLNYELFASMDYFAMLKNPFAVLAAIDLILGLCMALSATSLYPIVRFRAMAGLGFLVLYAVNFDQPVMAIAAAVGMLGLFINTMTLQISVFMLSGPMAIGGTAVMIYLLWTFLFPDQASELLSNPPPAK